MKGRFLASALLVAALAVAAHASGDVAKETLAETLYQEAVDHIRDGDYADACPKLEASHKADPAGGTVLLLAICYEQLGKTASAWIKFKEALAMARSDRRADRERRAQEHLTELEPRLSRVTVVISDEVRALPALIVKVDGTAVPTISEKWTMPVDPGDHVVEATATGKRPWSGTVSLKAEDAQRESIEVPMLEDAPEAPPPPEPAATPILAPEPAVAPETPGLDSHRARPGRKQRVVGVFVGGAGLATVGVGSYFGVQALRKDNDARSLCPDVRCTNPDGVELSSEANDHATRANVLVTTGAVVAATGVMLYLTAPKAKRRSTSWTLTPLDGGVAVGASGRF